MRRLLITSSLVLALAACGDEGPRTIDGRPGGSYRLPLTLDPGHPQPGAITTLTTRARHADDDSPVTGLQVVHERVVHNFIVARDFTSFAHIHHEDFGPVTETDLAAATFSFPYAFPRAGHYRMVSEFTHDNRNVIKHYDLSVGDAGELPKVKVDLARRKHIDGFDVELHVSPNRPAAGFETELVLDLRRDGRAVTDLALLLGSEVHVALWRIDGKHFGHAHSYTPHMASMMTAMHDRSLDPATRARRMADMMVAMIDMPAELVFPGPRIPVRLVFPEPGVYAVFMQCAPGGTPRVFDFMVEALPYEEGMDVIVQALDIPTVENREHQLH